MAEHNATLKFLGSQSYDITWQAMQAFTNERDASTLDEIWVVEHEAVFTQGQAGKAEHLIASTNNIPVIKTDRGGQVTYHGPGQLVVYPLINLKRSHIGVRDLVTRIEKSVTEFLGLYNIDAYPKKEAPGVYVDEKKIASLGLRVRRGCSFHGVAINIDADLTPFQAINPCGYAGLEMTRLSDLTDTPVSVNTTYKAYINILASHLGLSLTQY